MEKNDNDDIFDSAVCSDENTFDINFLGIYEEFISTLFYFYRRMSELNINTTEYALLAATTVFFSGTNHLAVKIGIKFSVEIMNFVVIRLFTDAECTNFVLILFHQNCLLCKSIPFSLHTYML